MSAAGCGFGEVLVNFVSQGNSILINGRQGPIGFQETVGILTGSILTSSLNHGFPLTPTNPTKNLDFAFTSLYANSPTDVVSPGEMVVIAFPVAVHRLRLLSPYNPLRRCVNQVTTKGNAQVCTKPLTLVRGILGDADGPDLITRRAGTRALDGPADRLLARSTRIFWYSSSAQPNTCCSIRICSGG